MGKRQFKDKIYKEALAARWLDDLVVLRMELVSAIVKIDNLKDDIEKRLRDGSGQEAV